MAISPARYEEIRMKAKQLGALLDKPWQQWKQITWAYLIMWLIESQELRGVPMLLP